MKLKIKNILKVAAKGLYMSMTLTVLGVSSLHVSAVTDAEMEQARAIAAKFYVRFANDGAGYLDNWTPSSMRDLEEKLKTKEKENLAAFKSISTPTNYGSWDKEKLVEYWSATFFKENGSKLQEKAAGNSLCKKEISKAITAMKVTPPSTQATPAAAPGADSTEATPSPESTIDEDLSKAEEEIAQAENQLQQDALQKENESSESSGTWVYILVLAILVAVVIFLVIYASRTMKGQALKTEERDVDEEEDKTETRAKKDDFSHSRYMGADNIAEETSKREKYAEALAAKSDEIRTLTRQLAEMESLAARLKEDNRRLKAELDRQKYAGASTSETHAHYDRRHEEGSVSLHESRTEPKEVYLGRVNARGVFVRADRHAVEGQSIFRLKTYDGVEGRFSLISNPIVEEQMLDDPGKWLSGGCIAHDMFNTRGFTAVKTEQPGTAVFRDGAWWVEKKARIRYE